MELSLKKNTSRYLLKLFTILLSTSFLLSEAQAMGGDDDHFGVSGRSRQTLSPDYSDEEEDSLEGLQTNYRMAPEESLLLTTHEEDFSLTFISTFRGASSLETFLQDYKVKMDFERRSKGSLSMAPMEEGYLFLKEKPESEKIEMAPLTGQMARSKKIVTEIEAQSNTSGAYIRPSPIR
jgi:hypothetical protein